uniref:Uncharacterized protein n=1 Tax=Rhizophora mucronata TaxID=61149 RepID=A0A2P2P6I3_RHIMU
MGIQLMLQEVQNSFKSF